MSTPTLPIRPAISAHLTEHKRVTDDVSRYLTYLEQRIRELEKQAQQQKTKVGWGRS